MKFIITSQYGAVEAVRGTMPHTGIDLAMPMNTPLGSFCDAVVERVVDYGNQNIGKGVILSDNKGHQFIYGHMNNISVQEGEIVHTGSLLGFSGSSGNSIGPHLHFGEQVNGKFVDPSHIIAKVDKMAGGVHQKNIVDMLTNPYKYAHDAVHDVIIEALSAIGDVIMDSLYLIALCGGGILIILRLLGFDHRWIKPEVLVGAYIIIRYLFS